MMNTQQSLFNIQDPNALREAYIQQFIPKQDLSAQQIMAGAGARMGTGLGRMLGGRTAAEAENEMIKQVFNQSSQASEDPVERLAIAAKMFREKGMEQRAMALEEQMLKMRKTQVETQAKEAEMMGAQQGYQMRYEGLKSRHPEMADEEARALAQDPAAFREIMKTPKVDTQVVETADGQMLINKQTGQPIANLGRSPDRGTRVNVNVSPTLKQAGAVAGLVKSYDELTKQERETLQTVTQTKSLLNEAAAADNSVAWESARTQLAKAVGEGRLSNEDIRRTGVDPRLVQGALDWVNKKTKGVPNQDIIQQLYAVATLLERASVDKINSTSKRTRAVAELEGIPQEQMDTLFPFMSTDRSPRKQPGSGSTVNWSDLK